MGGNSSKMKNYHGGKARKEEKESCEPRTKKRKFYNSLTPQQKQKYFFEGRCFQCGDRGHNFYECPRAASWSRITPRLIKKMLPRRSQPSTWLRQRHRLRIKATYFAKGMDQVKDCLALFLFDGGATHNFMTQELAAKMGVIAEDQGTALEEGRRFQESRREGKTLNWERTCAYTRLPGPLILHGGCHPRSWFHTGHTLA